MRSTARSRAPETAPGIDAEVDPIRWVLLLFRVFLAAIFLIAGISKVQSPHEFAQAVEAFNLLPIPLAVPFALILPWVEIIAASYLFAGFLGRLAGAVTAGMLLMFIVALLDALLSGNTAHPCGCFGSAANPIITALAGGDTVGWWDVIRDVVLLAMALAIAGLGSGALSVDEWLASRRSI
jgi:uncharacterized membrane protein YphA (DoxX/SURF4 family)